MISACFELSDGLWGLDIGVASATIALSALGAIPGSCNAGGFGGHHQAAYPYVSFFLGGISPEFVIPISRTASAKINTANRWYHKMREDGIWREIVLLFACSAVVIAAFAELRSLLPLPAASALVDLRTDKSENEHFIVLNMRDAGVYGHAMLTWIANEDGQRKTFLYGYYATRVGTTVNAFATSGEVIDEGTLPPDPKRESRLALVFWLDKDQFDSVFSRVGSWRRNGRYELFRRDCVSFVADMIAPLGLKIPSRILLPRPYDFIVSLMEINARRPHS
jgi:hypothetical protein